jgi:hypothetical protein
VTSTEFERPNSRLVYRTFHAVLGPVMKSTGYRRLPREQGVWTRQIGDTSLTVGVEANRYGWDELTGSTVSWGYSGNLLRPDGHLAGEPLACGDLYGTDTLLELQAMLRRFTDAIPTITEDQYYAKGLGNRSGWGLLQEMRRTPQLPALQGYGAVLPFYRPEHLTELAEWLAKHHVAADQRAEEALTEPRQLLHDHAGCPACALPGQ